jgi:glycosyltransferase involved in cell wall biosynthesis
MVRSVAERPLRILMIAPSSFFADYGCHVRILEEARYLQGEGHHVTVATYHSGRDPEGLSIHRARGVPWRTEFEVGSSRHKIAMDALLVARTLRSMWQVRPDIIHGHIHEGALIGLFLSKLWSCPLVCDLQGSLTGEMVDHHFVTDGGMFHTLFRRLERFINRSAPRILTSTALNAQLLQDEFGCDPERITYVPDCVNTDVFAPQPHDEAWYHLRRLMGIPDDRRVVVYLGLLAEYQGTDHLLEAAAQICSRRSDVHFVIAGFPNVDHYGGMAQALGIADHCSFPGKVLYDQAPAMLSLGDVAVSPKLSATEGAGKLLNYMAMGLPTVAFDAPVSREYLGDAGIYARAGDSSDLARCLEQTLDDVSLAKSASERLRERARTAYDWSQSGRQILEAYAEQLGGPGARRRSA